VGVRCFAASGAGCITGHADGAGGKTFYLITVPQLIPRPDRSHRNASRLGTGIVVFVCTVGAWSPARATCFEDAALYQHVNPLVLRAIAWQESRNRPDAMHVNANGSIDYGLMQINTVHLSALARYGIGKDALMSPCKNVYIAAWQLRRQIVRYGNTWAAVGAYHSATPALRDEYARQIAGILRRWEEGPERPSNAPIAQRTSVRMDGNEPLE
jgi:hypothetical protein